MKLLFCSYKVYVIVILLLQSDDFRVHILIYLYVRALSRKVFEQSELEYQKLMKTEYSVAVVLYISLSTSFLPYYGCFRFLSELSYSFSRCILAVQGSQHMCKYLLLLLIISLSFQ